MTNHIMLRTDTHFFGSFLFIYGHHFSRFEDDLKLSVLEALPSRDVTQKQVLIMHACTLCCFCATTTSCVGDVIIA